MGFHELLQDLSDPKNQVKLSYLIMISVALTVSICAYALVLAVSHTYRFYTATSGSMEPSIYPSDLIVADPNYQFQLLKKGDVILFSAPSNGEVVSHRVITLTHLYAGRPLGGSNRVQVLITQGDANARPIYGIDFPITQQNYIAKSVFVIRGGGDLLNWLAPTQMTSSQ